jgi:predicted DNA-binding transcriptional regulator YafY
MSWEVDPPVEVTLKAPDEHVDDVRRWLGEPKEQRPGDGTTELVYRVTNRSALRSRIYLLGPRVSVVGPEEMRDELIAELAQMAGE